VRETNPSEDHDLLSAFVEAFAVLDDLIYLEQVKIEGLTYHRDGDWLHWRPKSYRLAREELKDFRAEVGIITGLGGRLPPLYEDLISSYRWLDVDLELFALPANQPGKGLHNLARTLQRDEVIWRVTRAKGFFPFARASSTNYDPVCFNLKGRWRKGDCEILQLDHEAILLHEEIQVERVLAPTFRGLLEAVVSLSKGRGHAG
jgi:hypothetical protein